MAAIGHKDIPGDLSASDWQAILKAIAGLRFGHVTVVFHGGRVARIERTESQRLPKSDGGSTRADPDSLG
jgi:hypothetical protein